MVCFSATTLKSFKSDFGNPITVSLLKLRLVFVKPQIKPEERTVLMEFQQGVKFTII